MEREVLKLFGEKSATTDLTGSRVFVSGAIRLALVHALETPVLEITRSEGCTTEPSASSAHVQLPKASLSRNANNIPGAEQGPQEE